MNTEDRIRHIIRLFANSPDLLGIADNEGRFIELNNNWPKILGWDKKDLKLQKVVSYIHEDDVEATQNILNKMLEKDDFETTDFINRFKCKDGTYRWLMWAAKSKEGFIYFSAKDIDKMNKDRLPETHMILMSLSNLTDRLKKRGGSYTYTETSN